MIDKEAVLGAWEVANLPTPSYIIHETLLDANLATIDKVRHEAGVEIIVALKANATWHIFDKLAAHSDGATASSLAEARLVVEKMGCKAHTYAPVYVEEEIDAILECSNHITFNSLAQLQRYGRRAHSMGVSCGLRVNPEYSTVATDLYNPCIPQSRLGVLAADLEQWPEGVEGLQKQELKLFGSYTLDGRTVRLFDAERLGCVVHCFKGKRHALDKSDNSAKNRKTEEFDFLFYRHEGVFLYINRTVITASCKRGFLATLHHYSLDYRLTANLISTARVAFHSFSHSFPLCQGSFEELGMPTFRQLCSCASRPLCL